MVAYGVSTGRCTIAKSVVQERDPPHARDDGKKETHMDKGKGACRLPALEKQKREEWGMHAKSELMTFHLRSVLYLMG